MEARRKWDSVGPSEEGLDDRDRPRGPNGLFAGGLIARMTSRSVEVESLATLAVAGGHGP